MYQAPRGTQDILPPDQPYWRRILETAAELAEAYGYSRIDTPIFEETSLFERGVGEGTDIVEKEMYSFEDKGGMPITLRPEFTAGVMRAYIQHGMRTWPQPVKLYTTGPIFRYERPQAGRYRQHHQFNVEAIGEQDPALDLEVMTIAWHLYTRLGFGGLSFQLNSTGCSQCRPGYLRALVEYYRPHERAVCDDCRRRLVRNPLRVLDCKTESCQPIIAEAPHITDHLCAECADHFARLRHYLDLLGRSYKLNHRLVRGLDYYTKTVFEVWASGIGAQNALCGGGRYDGLVEELGGPPTPGVGFASGLERIVMLMKAQQVEPPPAESPPFMVAYWGEAAKDAAVCLADDLRMAGVGASVSFGDRSLKAQLRQANRSGSRFVIIIGPDELAAEQVTVRDLQARQQEVVVRSAFTAWAIERAGRQKG
jgi:histidyl-tRNA synthetase